MATNTISAPSASKVAPRSRRKKSGLLRQEMMEGWLFASPFILGFLLWTAFPMLLSAWMSFQEWDILTPAKWNGLTNYNKLFFGDPLFWLSLGNTAYLTFWGVPIGMVAALIVALAMNVQTPLTTLFRTLFFLPSQIPGVANAVLWALVFNAQYGILNQLLDNVGVGQVN